MLHQKLGSIQVHARPIGIKLFIFFSLALGAHGALSLTLKLCLRIYYEEDH